MVRKIQVLIGPLKDFEGGVGPQAIRLVSTGKDNECKIDFLVNKTLMGVPNQIDLVLTNLSSEVRTKLRVGKMSVEIFVGYVDSEMKRLAQGGVLSSTTQRNGADLETTVRILDGLGALSRSFFTKSFAGEVPVQKIVHELAETLSGVTIGKIDVSGKVGRKGRVLGGAVTDQLNRLADSFHFSWSIQDGVFQAIDDNRSSEQVHPIKSETNLLSVTPLLSGLLQKPIGVEVSSILDPRIQPGDVIEVNSCINSELNNRYKVIECQLTGGSHVEKWVMQSKCWGI